MRRLPESSRLRPGQVRDAIVDYLGSHPDGATVSEIYGAVRMVLGQDLKPSSIRSYLRLNANSLFERMERGRYRLRG